MANFNFNPVWTNGVYQLEQSDPVLGGPNGISNRAPRELSYRTDFLFKTLEVIFGSIGTESPEGILPLTEIVLPVESGGTGLSQTSAGNYLRGNQTGGYELVTAEQMKSHLRTVSYYDTVLTSKADDVIYVKGKGNLEWTTIGSWTGYASLLLGAFIFDTTTIARSQTIDAIGGTYKKSLYPALWAWANAQNKVVSAASWKAGTYFFVDLGGDNFRAPDIRNMFIRGTGTDADNANARALGSYQQDAIKNHAHGLYLYTGSSTETKDNSKAIQYAPAAMGGDGGIIRTYGANSGGVNASSSASSTDSYSSAPKSETRGENTALAPRIIAY